MSETLRRSVRPVASVRARELIAHSRRPGSTHQARVTAERVVRLDSGDPDFMTPKPIRDALAQAIEDGFVHYGNAQGDPELRALLAEDVSVEAGDAYRPEQIVVTHGATGALAAAILGLVDRGERVLTPEPTYSLYRDLVQLAGGEMIQIPTSGPSFDLDVDRLAVLMPGARLLVLCNPCNPTGAVYDETTLVEVARLARRHGVFVLVDEAYSRIVYSGVKHTSVLSLGLGELAVYVQSFSKTYAMTGWRLGFIAADEELAPAFTKIHRTLKGPLNSAVQRAAIAAVQLPSEWFDEMLREYDARRTLVTEGLKGSGAELCPPRGTFYAFLRYPGAVASTEMLELAMQHGVAVRAGSEYGPSGEGYLRVAFSASRQELAEGVRRLSVAMQTGGDADR